MRDIKDYSLSEWSSLLPLQYLLKQIRNDLLLKKYVDTIPDNLSDFIQLNGFLFDRDVAAIVAFEQPWALDWMLKMAKFNFVDTFLVVFDNSLRNSERIKIQNVCRSNDVPYFSLPSNRTKHVNRSHGNAMTWIYHNFINRIKPASFAFLDHDMIPVSPVHPAEKLNKQPIYGFRRQSKIDLSWNLWAGYCFYDYKSVSDIKLNFLYDFSRGLDTGGRNWECLYSKIDIANMVFAGNKMNKISDPVTGENHDVQIIDNNWLHIGGISYNNNFASKSQFCRNLAEVYNDGKFCFK